MYSEWNGFAEPEKKEINRRGLVVVDLRRNG